MKQIIKTWENNQKKVKGATVAKVCSYLTQANLKFPVILNHCMVCWPAEMGWRWFDLRIKRVCDNVLSNRGRENRQLGPLWPLAAPRALMGPVQVQWSRLSVTLYLKKAESGWESWMNSWLRRVCCVVKWLPVGEPSDSRRTCSRRHSANPYRRDRKQEITSLQTLMLNNDFRYLRLNQSVDVTVNYRVKQLNPAWFCYILSDMDTKNGSMLKILIKDLEKFCNFKKNVYFKIFLVAASSTIPIMVQESTYV